MAKVELGICHICGKYGKLSFEHVPPEAAFNDHRVLRVSFEQELASKRPDEFRGQHQQRGAGAFTLCEQCTTIQGVGTVRHMPNGPRKQCQLFSVLVRVRPSSIRSVSFRCRA